MTATGGWVGVAGAALFLVGVGVVVRSPGLVVAAAVVAGFLAARTGGDAPTPALRVDRVIRESSPDPGDDVRIEVTVTNEGGSLADLRLVDDVPAGLEVVDGPARHATAVRAGESTAFGYTVRAARGRHEWESLVAITRDPVGSDERVTRVHAGSSLRCVPTFEGVADLPLRGLTTPYAGRVPTDVGGSGVEFHAVREYRRGDPQARVDWNRAARTGELATLEFREERAATVVVLVDAQPAAFVAPTPDAENAVEGASTAAPASPTSCCPTATGSAPPPSRRWRPGTRREGGGAHRAILREAFATDPAFAPTPPPAPERGFSPTLWRRRFRRRLPSDAQLLFFTPLVDDPPVRLARRLDATDHLVTVVSPDPSGGRPRAANSPPSSAGSD